MPFCPHKSYMDRDGDADSSLLKRYAVSTGEYSWVTYLSLSRNFINGAGLGRLGLFPQGGGEKKLTY